MADNVRPVRAETHTVPKVLNKLCCNFECPYNQNKVNPRFTTQRGVFCLESVQR